MAELELKFQVPPERRAAVLRALQAGKTQRLHLQARYHDTAEGLLAAHRLALRLRQEGRAWVQTLKGSTGHLAEREEHDVPLARVPRGGPQLDVQRHHDCPVGQALLKLLAGHPEARLQQVYATDVWRTHRVWSHGGGRIEVAFDEGRIVAGDAEHALCELEFELKAGPPAALFALAARWCERHGLWLDGISKAHRGQLLAHGRRHAEAATATAPAIDRRTGSAHAMAHIVNACLAQIVPNAGELAAGCDDPEHLHQLRVGLRRLRTALRELPSLSEVPCSEEDLQALDEVFDRLGATRDLQVAASHIAPRLQAAGAPPCELPSAAAATAAPSEVVRAAAFQLALIKLTAYTFDVLHSPDTGHSPAGPMVDRLQHLHRQVAKAARRFEKLSVDDQHRVRKRLKRLRYLAEFAAPLHRRRAVERYLKALKPAQDALGMHNDEAVAEAAYREVAANDPAAWFAVGWLAGQRDLSARRCGKALRAIAEVEPFWR